MVLHALANLDRCYLLVPSTGEWFHKLLEHYVRVVPAIENGGHDAGCKQAQAQHPASIGLVYAFGLGEFRTRAWLDEIGPYQLAGSATTFASRRDITRTSSTLFIAKVLAQFRQIKSGSK